MKDILALSHFQLQTGKFIALILLIMTTLITPATAGEITTKPDPELLRRFEAERDAADADLRRAAELRKSGEEKIRRAKEMRKQSSEKAVRELCAIGALPASECP